jgi:hypothetical protein
MGVPSSEVGYTSATTGRGDHEVHKGHVVAFGGEKYESRVMMVKTRTITIKGKLAFSHFLIKNPL